ncbi:UPF0489 family protein [Candidatus Saccharibacteria bacterium]|nr:UPF0489 family protein [Candidatus Saccharibacteria bacterium]
MQEELKTLDKFKLYSYKDKPVYVHDDHRFVLPHLYDAQKKGLIPKPCKFIMFDAHHDLADVSDEAKQHLKTLRQQDELDEALFFDVVKNKLRGDDADWLKAAMELGWVSDVVVFGIRHDIDEPDPFIYTDSSGSRHTVFHSGSWPGEMLGFKGDLAEHITDPDLIKFWKILGWETKGPNKRHFREGEEKIMLNFDLDVFSMNYEDFLFPWRREVYEKRFLTESDYFTTEGWTGKLFVQGLAEKAGAITIAREPDYCGGRDNMEQIFTDLNSIVFDDQITKK